MLPTRLMTVLLAAIALVVESFFTTAAIVVSFIPSSHSPASQSFLRPGSVSGGLWSLSDDEPTPS